MRVPSIRTLLAETGRLTSRLLRIRVSSVAKMSFAVFDEFNRLSYERLDCDCSVW